MATKEHVNTETGGIGLQVSTGMLVRSTASLIALSNPLFSPDRPIWKEPSIALPILSAAAHGLFDAAVETAPGYRLLHYLTDMMLAVGLSHILTGETQGLFTLSLVGVGVVGWLHTIFAN